MSGYILSRGKADDKIHIIRLHFCFVGGTAPDNSAAYFTAVRQDIPPFGVRGRPQGAKQSAAGIGAVPGENIHMDRPKAEGTMVAGSISQWLHPSPAMTADKALVVFGKAFGFHAVPFFAPCAFRGCLRTPRLLAHSAVACAFSVACTFCIFPSWELFVHG